MQSIFLPQFMKSTMIPIKGTCHEIYANIEDILKKETYKFKEEKFSWKVFLHDAEGAGIVKIKLWNDEPEKISSGVDENVKFSYLIDIRKMSSDGNFNFLNFKMNFINELLKKEVIQKQTIMNHYPDESQLPSDEFFRMQAEILESEYIDVHTPSMFIISSLFSKMTKDIKLELGKTLRSQLVNYTENNKPGLLRCILTLCKIAGNHRTVGLNCWTASLFSIKELMISDDFRYCISKFGLIHDLQTLIKEVVVTHEITHAYNKMKQIVDFV